MPVPGTLTQRLRPAVVALLAALLLDHVVGSTPLSGAPSAEPAARSVIG